MATQNKVTEKVSVIIVNFNGKKWLKKCLDSLKNQTHQNYETIFVDNNSSDNSVQYVKQNYSDVMVIQNDKNDGFAKGNNIGLEQATGKYIILLNNDTYVEKDYIEMFVKVFEEFPNCSVAQSKIVLMNEQNKLDIATSFWINTTLLYYKGINQNADLPQYNTPQKMFTTKGASMIFRKEIADKIGLFDDDFWAYYEETDFCHRTMTWGYDVMYYPKTICYHAGGKTAEYFAGEYIQFHNFKNKLASFIHNFQLRSLIYIIPIHIIVVIIISIVWLLQGKPKFSLAIYKALWWNITNINKTLNFRNKVQTHRTINDNEYLKNTKRKAPLKYYNSLFTGFN